MPVGAFDGGDKLFGGCGALRLRQEIELQRTNIDGLRVALDLCISADIRLVERGFDLLEELRILERFGLLANRY